jgi:8-oxo-dGTP pyrophosphatase MutT (NUDIX family)
MLDPSGVRIIFTRRTDALTSHAGQVSFPGGRIDPTDHGPAAAALREMQEEMGVAPTRISVIGRIDEIITVTGYHITPIVGTLPPDTQFEPNPLEVARVLSVPLDALLDASRWQPDEREWKGQVMRLWKFPFEDDLIWGATAQMLRQFMELLWG